METYLLAQFPYKPCPYFRYFKSASEACDVLHCRELFSFGSGSFYDGRDAVEIMEAGSDTVIPCTLTFDSLIILDKKKALGHLSSMPCIDKAVPLRELLQTLEDCGEADSNALGTVYLMFVSKPRLSLTESVLRLIKHWHTILRPSSIEC